MFHSLAALRSGESSLAFFLAFAALWRGERSRSVIPTVVSPRVILSKRG